MLVIPREAKPERTQTGRRGQTAAVPVLNKSIKQKSAELQKQNKFC